MPFDVQTSETPKQHRASARLFDALFTTMSWLPLPVARSIGRRLGMIYYKLGKKRVHIARVNMDICFPELSPREKEERVKESFRQIGSWFMETGAIWTWPTEKILGYVEVKNPELYEQAVADERGVILAIPHLGNWEVMGPFVTRDREFACFYKPDEKNPGFSEFLRRQRSRNGTVMASTDARGIRLLYKQLKAGKVVGLLPDHNPTEEMGVFAPFFGRPALTGTLISSLARKNRARVLTAAVIRTRTGFEVHFGNVENQHGGDPELAARSLNEAIEACIALAPAQFHWVYPRFRKRPDPSQPSPYR
ncbi:lysophospholipid acyltransferase family protein [Gilvimarinus sp. F26214L]|uniref:lysophospholipid acyltransferase family protein n=1 Tax=Gilvimarinus sp. DZF01 TaxID=3461371 RepID=UPI0040459E37